MNILVVDDNPTNVMLIREILQKAEYPNVLTASTAKEMFRMLGITNTRECAVKANELDVDLILLDMMMPGIDGLDACRDLQRYSQLRDIPIIIVTAISDSNTLAKALDAGAVDYVTKPINRIELLARIRLALRFKQERDWHKARDRHISEELRLAASVQASVLTEPYEDEHIKIRAVYQPSEELAGDLYAWFPLEDHKYGIFIMDMMGHGVSSALLSMFIASALRDSVFNERSPDRVLQDLNSKFQYIHLNDTFMTYYMTAIYAVVDTENNTICYANAGHPPGIVMMDDGEVVRLDSTGYPVGMFSQLVIEARTITCSTNYRLGLYTDGLLEAAAGELEQAVALLSEYIKRETSVDSQAWQELFRRPSAREDDICLVWAQVKCYKY